MDQKPKTKILICGILPPPYFGHSMMYHMLMQSEFVRAYDVVFLNMQFWTYEQHKKVTLGKLFKLVKYFFCYMGLLIRERPQYILYNMSFYKMPFLKDYAFCLTGKLLGGRIVLHDMGRYLQELYGSSSFICRAFIRHLLKMTSASIVLGENARLVYEGRMDTKRVVVVPGSVEDSAGVQIQASRSEDKTEVLYFSFLSASKGVFTALEAVPQVVLKNPNVVFTFAGPVESEAVRAEINRFIEEHKLQSHIRLTGYVGDSEERTRLFRHSDIFIFPTQRDVFGLVILHAMAEGRPVVASREGGVPEIVEDGRNGFLFAKGKADELAERILALAADRGLRQRIGEENRRKYLDAYSPERYGRRMIEAFETIEKFS